MTSYAHALRRFWWVPAIGVLASAAVFIFIVYQVRFSPLALVERSDASSVASAQLLVTNTKDPYLRTSQPDEIPGDGSGTATRSSALTALDANALVQAANLYPILIQSDDVANIRTDSVGPIPGSITAEAMFSLYRPFGGYEPSSVPVVRVFATSPTDEQALALAGGTIDAFLVWLGERQQGAGIAPSERIMIDVLQAPRLDGTVGGTSYELPALAAAATFVAFLALALLLDRMFPKREPVRFMLAPTIDLISTVPDRANGGAEPSERGARLHGETSERNAS